jgi:hypothetical protein
MMYGYKFSDNTKLWCHNSSNNMVTGQKKKKNLAGCDHMTLCTLSLVRYHRANTPNHVVALIYIT